MHTRFVEITTEEITTNLEFYDFTILLGFKYKALEQNEKDLQEQTHIQVTTSLIILSRSQKRVRMWRRANSRKQPQ